MDDQKTAHVFRHLTSVWLLLVTALVGSACQTPRPPQASCASPTAGQELDPVANGVTVLAYNTHLFKGSSAQVGVVFKDVWGDVARLFSSREGLLGLLTGEYYDKRNAPRQKGKSDTDGPSAVASSQPCSQR